jgi:hypothetical protein
MPVTSKTNTGAIQIMVMRKIARMMHDLAACVHLRDAADSNGEFTNAAIRRAYGNSQSSRSRIERLIQWGLIENVGRNRYRFID